MARQHTRTRRNRHRNSPKGRSARQQLEASALEADYQEAIEQALTAGGWRWHHDENVRLPSGMFGISARGQEGWPDIVAVHRERRLLLVLELKSHRGRLTIAQRGWLEAFMAIGADVRAVRPADYDELLDHILGDRLLQRHRRPVGTRA